MDSLSTRVSDKINHEIGEVFKNTPKRLRIWSDVDKFNWKEDESIWKQHKGLASKEYEIYFDREFLCTFSDKQTLEDIVIVFLNSLKRLYKEGQIYVHEEVYKVKDEEARQKRLAQEAAELAAVPQATSREEEIVRDVVVKTKKRKYGKR